MDFSQLHGGVINILISIACSLFALHFWARFTNANYYNPYIQTIVKLTQWLITPLSKFIKSHRNIEFASIFVIYILLLFRLLITIKAGVPTILLLSVLSVVKFAGYCVFYLVFIRAILSWFPSNRDLHGVLASLTEPFLAKIRSLLPSTGMFDFSVMVLVFILYLINSFLASTFGILWVIL